MSLNYSYQEALDASTLYFEGDELAAKVFVDKYCLRNKQGRFLEKDPSEMHRRIAKEFARIESKFPSSLTEEQIFESLDHFKYIIPQGSPMFGIGNDFQTISLSNCYVVPSPEDSYGGIMRCDEQLVQICKRRGGVGAQISKLRPNGAPTNNAALKSTGMISFSERFSNTIREVAQSGRRGALMLNAHIKHPDSVIIPDDDDPIWTKPAKITIKGVTNKGERDIETASCYYDPDNLDFASMKLDRQHVTGANVSLLLTDEFMDAVLANKPFEQKFPIDSDEPYITKSINARRAWEKIIHMAWQSAEPGLLFWDRIKNYNAIDCYKDEGFETISTNPCSEIPLCEYDSCRLMVLNLYSFVDDPFSKKAKFNFEKFKKYSGWGMRLMDDLIELELEKVNKIIKKISEDLEDKEIKRTELSLWKNIKKKCEQGRRTGLGINALGDTFAAMGIKYGGPNSIKLCEDIFRAFKHASFEMSSELAKERGHFPIWDWKKEKNSEFLKLIKEENEGLYHKISKNGRRNIGLLTVAPTGSVSILTQTTSGIEPLFALEPYTRRKKIIGKDETAKVDFVDQQGDRWQHFEVYHPKVKVWMEKTGQTDLQKSPWFGSTAPEIDWAKRVKLQSIMQKHIDHAISSTINLPNGVEESVVADIYEYAWSSGCKGMTVYRDGCRSGVLINKNDEPSIQKSDAPKRGKELDGEMFSARYKGEKLYVAVGLINGEPYEVFTGMNTEALKTHKGKIRKMSKGKYHFINDGEDFHLTNGHNDPTADGLTRMVSCALRHGADINFVVHQLEKTEGDLMSFAKVLGRVLKKFIPDGSQVSGESCPECSGELHRQEGCVTCKNCGWSKCA